MKPYLKFGPTALTVVVLFLMWAFAVTRCYEPDVAHADASAGIIGPTVPLAPVCPFYHGWNLTVLNGSPADLPPCVKVVWRYETFADRWFFWGKDNPVIFNDLTSFEITKGYWVWASN